MLARDRIWIIGDEFANNSVNLNFTTLKEDDAYTPEHFEIKTSTSKEYGSHIRSLLGRLRNNVFLAIKKFGTLPKIMVIITEDDFVKSTKRVDISLIENMYNKMLNWLMNEIRKLIAAYNDFLPKRCKRNPHIMWVLPTEHINHSENEASRRSIFAKCIMHITKLHTNHRGLDLKQIWDKEDSNLYIKESARITPIGTATYWRAVDRTIKFYDFIITKNEEKKLLQSLNASFNNNQQDESRPSSRSFVRNEYRNFTMKRRNSPSRKRSHHSSRDDRDEEDRYLPKPSNYNRKPFQKYF